MKTPHSVQYQYTRQAIAHANKLTVGTVSEQAHKLGMENGEALIVCMDELLKYARSYRKRYQAPLQNDGVLGGHWLEAVKGVRGLLNGDGELAMSLGITTDSKDNGTVEALFWDAMAESGFEEKDI